MRLRFALLLFFFVIIFTTVHTQTTDNILWAGVQVKQNLGERTNWAVKPILRLNEDLSAYENWSIDLSVTHRFADRLSVRFLHRTWFIPEQTDRHFFWLDLIHNQPLGPFKWSNQLRLHYAADVKERVDGDFIRFQSQFMFTKLGKVKPFVGVEPWFQMGDFQQWQRIRYQGGIRYQLSQRWSVAGVLWREVWWNNAPDPVFNIWVVSLNYQLPTAKD
ncbi:MAG: DUF2490 domain-containing protein [Bacteroidota bacterium]